MLPLKIGIFGLGIVGEALEYLLDSNSHHNILVNDPKYSNTTVNLHLCDVVFVCTPEQAVEDCVLLANKNAQIFIRSTVMPGTCDSLMNKHNKKIWSMPEFLTGNKSERDMQRLPIVTGCPDRALVQNLFPGKYIYHMNNKQAELAKLAHNAFGALKVSYFNTIYLACEKLGVDYADVKQGMLASGQISPEHTMVPGYDGQLGFDGKCLPKDLKAMRKFFNVNGLKGDSLLDEVMSINQMVRP